LSSSGTGAHIWRWRFHLRVVLAWSNRPLGCQLACGESDAHMPGRLALLAWISRGLHSISTIETAWGAKNAGQSAYQTCCSWSKSEIGNYNVRRSRRSMLTRSGRDRWRNGRIIAVFCANEGTVHEQESSIFWTGWTGSDRDGSPHFARNSPYRSR
jgi:hypothetical protein